GPWETTTLIGGTCKRGNAFSGPVLIARGLDFEHVRCCYGVLKVCRARKSSRGFHNFGGHTGRETPLPIPNREVKPARADGTRRATSRESRSPPIYLAKPAPLARASLVSGKVLRTFPEKTGQARFARVSMSGRRWVDAFDLRERRRGGAPPGA